MRDGSDLARWPAIGAAAPFAAVTAGLALGATDDRIYAASTLTVAILLAIGGLGGALGLAAFVGFVVGDLAIRNPASAQIWGGAPGPTGFAHLYGPFLISYAALAGALVFGPVAASARRRVATSLPGRGSLGASVTAAVAVAVQGGLSAGFIWLWTRGAELAVLPLWTYNGRMPQADAVQALTGGQATVVAVAGCASALSGLVAVLGRESPNEPAHARRRALIPWPVGVLARAALTTALFSGLATDRADAIVMGGILVALFAVRAVVFPRADRLTTPLSRFPMLLRLAAASGIAYVIRAELVTSSAFIGSFNPALLALLVSVFLGSVLLAPEALSESGYRRPLRTAAAAAAILVLALPAAALAGTSRWWTQPIRRAGTTIGHLTVSGRLSSGGFATEHLDGTFACVYDATQGVTPDMPGYSIKGEQSGPLSEVFILVSGFNGNARGTPVIPVPGRFPFGQGPSTATVVVDNGYTLDPMVPGAHGSVRLAADGSGTVSGTLTWPEGLPVAPGTEPPFGFGRIAISGSWGPCSWGSFIPTETPGDTAAVVVPALLVMLLLDGLGSLGGLGGAAAAAGEGAAELFSGPEREIGRSTVGEAWVSSAGIPTNDAAARSIEEWSRTVGPARAGGDGWATALATDGRLAGRNMTADDLTRMSTAELEDVVGRRWDWTPDIVARLQAAGPGGRGIVWACEADTGGHFFNAVNRAGHVVFVNSQVAAVGGDAVFNSWNEALREALHAAKEYFGSDQSSAEREAIAGGEQRLRVGLIQTHP